MTYDYDASKTPTWRPPKGPAKPGRTEAPPVRPDTPAPEIDYYVHGDPLGEQGAMSVVSHVEESNLEGEFIVRVNTRSAEANAHEQYVARYLQEAGELDNVVGIRAVAHDTVVMSKAPGIPLSDLLQQFPNGLPPKIATQIAKELAKGLAALDNVGLAHNDLKPANTIVEIVEGQVRSVTIIDPFMATATKEVGLKDGGVRGGTPEYGSPEQFHNKPSTGKSDVYALGKILYKMLTGRPLFGEQNVMKLIRATAFEPITPDHSELRSAPPNTRGTLGKLLAFNPADRASASEAVGHLEQLERNLPAAELPEVKPTRDGRIAAADTCQEVAQVKPPVRSARAVAANVGSMAAGLGIGLVTAHALEKAGAHPGITAGTSILTGTAAGALATRGLTGAFPSAGTLATGTVTGVAAGVFASQVYNSALDAAGVKADSAARQAPAQIGVGLVGGTVVSSAGVAASPFTVFAVVNELPALVESREVTAAKASNVEKAREQMAHDAIYADGWKRYAALGALGLSLVPIFNKGIVGFGAGSK
ncbi:MAG: protein kinase [Candidatus Margulisbacteria bacterium]|jgi:hypothetical protein|nr:protein kinase [Candidatus Margulisiibacteriota bacterium]